ncbi:Protein of unknown function [Cotesia congregata]|uniref:Uncharacterized protein n=1 Tax=Cotesia congregata TaxID=51543 RepID=A0A8J2MQJ7_COTCN|nr:Protein of unknown function [Cotesia congregata]
MAGALSENAPRPVSVVTVDGGTPQTVEPPPETTIQENSNANGVRCFASTEAQTDMGLTSRVEGINPGCDDLRDARRRERRVRRHHRRAMRSCSMPPTYPGGPGCVQANAGVGTAPGMPLVPPVGGYLHPPPPHLGLRGLSLGLPFPVPASVSAFGRDAVPKQCCGLGSPPVRWSILGVGIVGLVCAAAGALLGALRATGRDHIAVSLLMIGIGVVLLTVSGVAWRVTSRENCGSFFGFTGISARIPPARPMHPYAAMIYPEFQFRTPPPSYQASMQEYRLRLLLLDRLQPTSSPPPTYRSNAASIIAPCTTRESRPPSYCGRGNVTPNATLAPSTKKDANLVRIVQTESEPLSVIV